MVCNKTIKGQIKILLVVNISAEELYKFLSLFILVFDKPEQTGLKPSWS